MQEFRNFRYYDLYFFLLAALVASIPLSEYTTSVSQFLLLAFWMTEGIDGNRYNKLLERKGGKGYTGKIIPVLTVLGENIYRRFESFFSRENRPALIFWTIFLLHVAGLIFTTDFHYAAKDLRIKLPLLMLPVVLSTIKPLDQKRFNYLLLVFVAAVVVGSLFGVGKMLTDPMANSREYSIFISHIRFSLNTALSLFILAYFIFTGKTFSIQWRVGLGAVMLWLVIFLVILKSASGIIVTLVTIVIMLLGYALFKANKTARIFLIVVAIAVPAGFVLHLNYLVNDYLNPEPVDFTKLEQYTPQGNKYVHDTVHYGVENGRYTGLYIANEELKKEWNERSELDFGGKDERGQVLRKTLIRYLHSKGYRKDSVGVNKLSKQAIRNIEHGIGNVHYLDKFSLKARLYPFLFGYRYYLESGNPNNNSVIQRLEYWKASYRLIQDNWLTGVGTGDIDNAFMQEYKAMDSKLEKGNRHRAHNQFLAIAVAFGIPGLLWFLFALVYPPVKMNKLSSYFFGVFFIIGVLSMIPEDTLESQPGATFFAFFYCLFLFMPERDYSHNA
ncbi:MAG: O-antigen ligase family protein [Bacteroidales bacterium]|nr:O-antigen ligase family protein [Bacteroidales bacterium]